MGRKLKVLFFVVGTHGHLNSCVGVANGFEKRGHESIFLADKNLCQSISKQKYQYLCIEDEHGEEKPEKSTISDLMETMLVSAENEAHRPTIERFGWIESMHTMLADVDRWNTNFERCVKKIMPDLIVLDFGMFLPAFDECQIPYVNLFSPSPHILYGDKVPPIGSGYATDNPASWIPYREKFQSMSEKVLTEYNQYLIERGYKPMKAFFEFYSPYILAYSYPRCLDFHEIAKIDDRKYGEVFRLDGFQRDPSKIPQSPIPSEFLMRPGKLVFFSLGSFFSCNVRLMNDILSILKKSPHKFIISKGIFGDRLKLGDNMWGENFVNQLQVLEMVDAAIIHGGNNTTVECFYHGVPMIVIPTLGDQPDNAQRIAECGFGVRIDIADLGEQVLLDSLEKILADRSLRARMSLISQEMRTSKRLEQLVDKLENLVEEGKIYNAREEKWFIKGRE